MNDNVNYNIIIIIIIMVITVTIASVINTIIITLFFYLPQSHYSIRNSNMTFYKATALTSVIMATTFINMNPDSSE